MSGPSAGTPRRQFWFCVVTAFIGAVTLGIMLVVTHTYDRLAVAGFTAAYVVAVVPGILFPYLQLKALAQKENAPE